MTSKKPSNLSSEITDKFKLNLNSCEIINDGLSTERHLRPIKTIMEIGVCSTC